MIRRVGLLGGECTGKSALGAALADALPGCLVPESLRAFVVARGRAPRQDEQVAIMRQQAGALAQAERDCIRDWLVCDPAPLMTAVYSEIYFGDVSLVDEAIEHAAGFDLLLWCDVDIPWHADGTQRDGPQWRTAAHEVLERLVRDEPIPVPIVRVGGSLKSRLALALAACRTLRDETSAG